MPNQILQQTGTPIVWTDTGGDFALDLGGLAAGGVRAGDIGDLGSGDRASLYDYVFLVDGFDTAPVVGEVVRLYLALGNSNSAGEIVGDLSGTDGASSTVVLPNLVQLKPAVVQTTTAANELIVSGIIEIRHRYVIPVVHNDTADALLSTSDAHKFILTPHPLEVQ